MDPLSTNILPVEQRSWTPTVGGYRLAPCDLEGHDLALVVNGQMELEAKEPAHGSAVLLQQVPRPGARQCPH